MEPDELEARVARRTTNEPSGGCKQFHLSGKAGPEIPVPGLASR
jgi:hypothetical protein